jgi:hypothetical protein
MKITFEIPNWAEERNLYFFAGIELMAYKTAGKKEINIKTKRCNQCGECCRSLPKKFPIRKDENNTCVHLKKTGNIYSCSIILAERPYVCAKSDPVMNNGTGRDYCSIRYEAS